jgi:hypothetical protein
MPDIDYIRAEIERMRAQVHRQRREIWQLQRAGIPTASAEALLERMLAKIDELLSNATISRKNSPEQRGAKCWAAADGERSTPLVRPQRGQPAMDQGARRSSAFKIDVAQHANRSTVNIYHYRSQPSQAG